MKQIDAFHLTPESQALDIPNENGQLFSTPIERGQLSIELYSPRNEDLQKPHTRDEVYVIVEGTGTFIMGDNRVSFKPGDFLFVPAGMEHRFVDFGKIMSTWVIFYGAEGGDIPEQNGAG